MRNKLDEFEAKHSLEEAKAMARAKGVSPIGTKREIAMRILAVVEDSVTAGVKTYSVRISVTYTQAQTSAGRRYVRERMGEIKRRILAIDPKAEIKSGFVIGDMDVKTTKTLTAKMLSRNVEVSEIGRVPMTSGSRSKYLGNWQPGDFAIYGDFGLRSLYIVRILPWPEGEGDRLTEQRGFGAVAHDRLGGSVRAEVIDSSMVDWDFDRARTLYEWQEEGTVHYYNYTNLYRNIEELIKKEKRTIYPEVLVRILYDLRRHPGWLMLAAYGLRNEGNVRLPQTEDKLFGRYQRPLPDEAY